MKVLIVEKNRKKGDRIASSLPADTAVTRASNPDTAVDLYMTAKIEKNPYDYVISGIGAFVSHFRSMEKKLNGKIDIPAKIVYAADKNGFRSVLEAYENGANAFVGPEISYSTLSEGFDMCGVAKS